MSTILVDYENINGAKLALGLDLLNAKDTLVIFYSAACNTMRKEYIDIIAQTGCDFQMVRLLNKGKDNLDRYICTMVGEVYARGENEIAIISKDKGFQAVIEYFRVMGKNDLKIVKHESIEQALAHFNTTSDKERRKVIFERSRQISLDEIRSAKNEQNRIKKIIGKMFEMHPDSYSIDDLCEFVLEHKNNDNKMQVYTSSMHRFGREKGRVVYRLIKDIVI